VPPSQGKAGYRREWFRFLGLRPFSTTQGADGPQAIVVATRKVTILDILVGMLSGTSAAEEDVWTRSGGVTALMRARDTTTCANCGTAPTCNPRMVLDPRCCVITRGSGCKEGDGVVRRVAGDNVNRDNMSFIRAPGRCHLVTSAWERGENMS
jgi:hypothetical protein